MKNVRGLFPKSYRQLLEQERLSCGDPMLDRLPERLQTQTIAELIEFCQDGVHKSLSGKARAMVDEHAARINQSISAECINIFEFAQRMQLHPCPERSDSTRPSSLKALTKRGMAEPRSKRRK